MMMTRRNALTVLASVPFIPSAGTLPCVVRIVDVRFMSTEDFYLHAPFHTMLDGVDITGDVFRTEEYSDGTMRAFCYVKDAHGDFVLHPVAGVETEMREGHGSVTSRLLNKL